MRGKVVRNMRLIAHTDVIELSQLFTHKLRIRMQEALYVCSAQIFLFVCMYVYPFEGRTFSSMCANDLRPNLLWIFAVLYAFILYFHFAQPYDVINQNSIS